LGLSPDQMVTFMSDGVATRIQDSAFVDALKTLKSELGLSPDQMVTFMSGSVATRIQDSAFVDALKTLKSELGLSPAQMVTFMSNSVATRIQDSAFVDALKTLKTKLSLKKFLSFVSRDPIACRIADRTFCDLIEEGHSIKRVMEIARNYPIKKKKSMHTDESYAQ
jgi:hypothetical protein